MAEQRPIRFGAGPGMIGDPRAVIDAAVEAEKSGFSTFGIADHFMIAAAPLVTLQAVADATTSLRVTMTVLDQDFRHPAVLAKELATLDVLSGGRVEVGIGAGWLRAEYEQAGIAFDKASVRIERLEEQLIILKGLFAEGPFSFEGKHYRINGLVGTPTPVQRPRPPIMVGGGGRKLLSAAARQADIVQVSTPNSTGTMVIEPAQLTAAAFEERLAWVREAAGDRFDEIELSVPLMGLEVVDDRQAGVKAVIERFGAMLGADTAGIDETLVRESPMFAVGNLDQVCEKLLETRQRYGFSYFLAGFGTPPDAVAAVIGALAGK